MKAKNFTFRIKQLLVIPILLTQTIVYQGCKKENADNFAVDKYDAAKNPFLNKKFSATAIPVTAYDVTNALPKNYVKDGSKDYTTYLQDAINKNSNLVFPAFPIMVNDRGLTIGSNKTITFMTGSQLLLKPTASGNYSILRISNAGNITLNNPVLVGERYNHIGDNGGEWGQGIGLYGAYNVTINGPRVSNCWGDGIYLAAKDRITNKNIKIYNAYCKNNRRNGISVTCVDGLLLEAPYAGYSDGTPPSAGIDFEAETFTDELKNVVINSPKTEYNTGAGILIGFRSLFGGPNKTVSFQINYPMDKGSNVGFKTSAILTRRVGNETVTGSVSIINPYWRKNTLSPLQANLLVRTIQLKIIDPVIQDIDGNQLSESSVYSILTYKYNLNLDSNYLISFL
ncbi:right-handed parallel beta-helix repeat-containing protein [Mucilaginibacter sp.]|uniref:right-handed parallel beta-helix repeat-containing protein n=1 Tax=Mucilaginibacter sp. TaxID=1882438 RepID=UPI0026137103|nr:right-handed parallel beta-helix repeat-containing protein [Mucilaginibacter sp.]MDB5126761.1 hypothetical protein [Mucilaginibacter sp.]